MSQRSTSARVFRMTGIAFGWIGATTAFGCLVRKAKRSFSVSPSLTLRTDFQRVRGGMVSKRYVEKDRSHSDRLRGTLGGKTDREG